MKKKILSAAVVLTILVTVTGTAFAHGHHGRSKASRISPCPTKSCTLTGTHKHNGKTYAAHYYGDGHNYHDYCGISNCTLSGYHSHNGSYCFGHTANDGHSYHHTGTNKGHH